MGPEVPEAWLAFVIKHIIEHHLIQIIYTVVVGGAGAMLTALIYGRHHKKEKRDQEARDRATGERIAALEAEIRRLGGGGGSVVVNVNNDGGDSSLVRELLGELKAQELELTDLRTLVGRLTPKPVPGTSATYVKLPEGSRVVVMDDDSIRVALPVSVEEHLRIAETVEAVLNPDKKETT